MEYDTWPDFFRVFHRREGARLNVWVDTQGFLPRRHFGQISFDLKSVSGSVTVGAIRTARGLRTGFGSVLLMGQSISGSVSFQ